MTSYPREAYGTVNPNAGRPANGDRTAWGGHAWPQGVPSNLLGTTDHVNKATGQRLRVTIRRELVPLWQLLFAIADTHDYPIWAHRNGENWGPWGYSNRAVSGTNTPSGHSMALSVDINAPLNPYSSKWQSDMPPAMVADFEACGQYWGGRYTPPTPFDPMHYGYCFPPASVAGHIARAQQILGATPQPPGKDWFDMATEEDLRRVVAAELDARSLTPTGINDLVANVMRADEFRLDRDRRQQDQFNTSTEWARSDEFALDRQRTDVVAIKNKLDA